ncbi:MAG: transcription-repair coupling factor, partial [Flavobacteriales bacterium]|nr:transcription-repair coupling factor [Flavobacteriales bacterium]
MNSSDIKSIYLNTSQTKRIVQQFQENELSHIHLKGLLGSTAAFYANAVYENLPVNFFIILNDKEEAAYFFNDLERVVGGDKVLFFPNSYRNPYQAEQTDNANVLMRAEVLSALSKSSSTKLIVTHPAALSEKVITKKILKKNTLKLKVEEEIPLNNLIEKLNEYQFERVDFVVEPGQFSIRGGIVDVFSFSNENPYRIEFFGDEIASVRSFDPVSQLSIKNYQKVTILPNIQNSMLEEMRISILNYLPKNTIVWTKDIALIAVQLEKDFTNAQEAYKKVENSPLAHLIPEEIYYQKNNFSEDIVTKNTIEFGNQFHLEADLEAQFNLQVQPIFNKNFELLHQDLLEKREQGYKVSVLADSSKQIKRLSAIFEDIGKALDFNSILLTLHEGFIDNDNKIALYTDHQIFNRYQRFHLKDSYKKKSESLTLKELHGLSPGDFITHIDHGVGRFSGLEKIDVNGKQQEAIRIVYANNDLLYVSIHSLHKVTKFVGKDGIPPSVNKLGSPQWQTAKQKTKSKIKEVAFDLIKLYAERKSKKGYQFMPDTYLQDELEASFIYEDTPDQLKATQDVKKDMEADFPMDRLICGDVGFGK